MEIKNTAQRWLDYAETDLQSAKALFKTRSKEVDKRRYRLVIWLCHQTIEKMLKRAISLKGKQVIPIHDLLRLYKSADIAFTDEQVELIKRLNTYYIPPRYPDLHYTTPLPPFTKERAAYFLKSTETLFVWLKQSIRKKS